MAEALVLDRVKRRLPAAYGAYVQLHALWASRKEPLLSAGVSDLGQFRKYADSLESGDPISERVPWMNYQVVNALKSWLRPDMTVFEWGSGGSTLFWLDAGCSVISIEHDQDWAGLVSERLVSESGGRLTLRLIRPIRISRDAQSALPPILSTDAKYRDFDFRPYVEAILEYPDQHFDLIVVDGRARSACLRKAASKLKPSGILLLDQSERLEYAAAVQSLGNAFNRTDFAGPTPFQRHFTQTSILRPK